MIELVKDILAPQFAASLCMLGDCIIKCPADHWDGKIAKYPCWNVAYHTLCFADLYLSQDKASWTPRAIHPKGYSELLDEYPSRRFEKPELVDYLEVCRRKAVDTIAAETPESLEQVSGFHWYPVPRLELHFINIRHIQHHTGQLSASLRRIGVEAMWVGTGWK